MTENQNNQVLNVQMRLIGTSVNRIKLGQRFWLLFKFKLMAWKGGPVLNNNKTVSFWKT